MKKKIIVLTLALVGVGVFAAVLVNTGWREIWAMLYQITLWQLLIYLVFIQISYAIFNWRWQIILKTHGHKVSFWSLWLYRACGYGVSYITPTPVGGEPARIYFLNENHDIGLKEATASVFLDKLIELSCFVLFVASGVLIASLDHLLPKNSGYLVIGVLTVFIIFFIYVFKKLFDNTGFATTIFKTFGLKKIKKMEALEEKIYRTEKLIMDFLSHTDHKKTTLPFIIFLSILGWIFTIFEYYLIGRFLGFDFSGYESFLISTVPSLAYLMPIPGGFGVLEGLGAGMFVLLGYTASAAIAVLILVRLKEVLFSAIGFIYALTHGVSLIGKKAVTKQVMLGNNSIPDSFSPHKNPQPDNHH